MSDQQYFKIAGPPGTGKTTYLVNLVSSLLEQKVPSSKILYTTFTRAGANEAKNRAAAQFNLSEEDLRYFKTLHALCYRSMPSGFRVMTAKDWVTLGKAGKYYFSLKKKDESGLPTGATKGDHLLHALSLSRNWGRPLKDSYLEYTDNHRFRYNELEYFANMLRQYKENNGVLDYTDLLENYLENGVPFDIDHAIGDEMQDLTPLQWQVFQKMSKYAGHVYYAGDDDQTIYEWTGALSDKFLDAPGELTILDQSYRIPKTVHDVADTVVNRISHRIEKEYKPRAEEGVVEKNIHITDVDMSKGKWLVLARNNAFVLDMQLFCNRRGWRAVNSVDSKADSDLGSATAAYLKICAGEHVEGKALKAMATRLERGLIKHGWKHMWDNIHDNDLLSLEDLRDNYGFCPVTNLEEAFPMSSEEASFIRAMLKNGEFDKDPRIEISTIHNAKGRECDNVVLLPDMTLRTKQGFLDNPDAEHRVWYVGVTRARERLVIPQPLTEHYYAF